jgi:hypothetical protein
VEPKSQRINILTTDAVTQEEPRETLPTLAEADIDKKLSSRAQNDALRPTHGENWRLSLQGILIIPRGWRSPPNLCPEFVQKAAIYCTIRMVMLLPSTGLATVFCDRP